MAGTDFNSKARNVGELLGSTKTARIIVPTFQRGYSWLTKQVEAFWKDVMQFRMGPNKSVQRRPRSKARIICQCGSRPR